jgi:large subunit ribosomal protein L17
MVSSLFEHGRVSTTIEKAKEVKGFAEKLITMAKKGDLASRRRVISLLGKRNIVEYEDGKAVKKGTVVNRLFSEIAPRYLDRPGGYTRIIKLAKRRLGDNGQVVLLQLVGENDKASSGGEKKSSNKRTRRAEIYAEMTDSLAKQPKEEVEVAEEVEAAQEVQQEETDEAPATEEAQADEEKAEQEPEVDEKASDEEKK